MDLNSLPDEMLIIILKKLTFPRMLQLRRMNKRIDRLARRYDILVRLPVDVFEIKRTEVLFLLSNNDLLEDLGGTVIHIKWSTKHKKNYAALLQKFLSRLKICEELTMDKLEINQEILDVLIRNQKSIRLISTIKLRFLVLLVPLMSYLCKLCPHLTIFNVHCCNYNLTGNMFENKISCKRSWNRLAITGIFAEQFLFDDQFLLDVAPYCQDVRIWKAQTNFTLSAVIEMFKRCLVNKTHVKQKIVLMLNKSGMSLERLQNVLETEIPGAQLTNNNGYLQLICRSTDKEVILGFQEV